MYQRRGRGEEWKATRTLACGVHLAKGQTLLLLTGPEPTQRAGIQGQTRRAEPGFLRASVGHSHQEQDTEPWSCLPGAEPGRVVESSIVHWLQPKSVLQRRIMSVLHHDVRGKGKWELQFRFPGHCHMSPGGGQDASVVWTLPRRQGQSPGQAGHCESHPWGQSQRLPALS